MYKLNAPAGSLAFSTISILLKRSQQLSKVKVTGVVNAVFKQFLKVELSGVGHCPNGKCSII